MDIKSMSEILQLYMMQNLSKINSDETQPTGNNSSELFANLLQEIIKGTSDTSLQNNITQLTPAGTNLDNNSTNLYEDTITTDSLNQPVDSKIDKAIEEAAQKYGVDGEFIKAIVKQESGFNPNSVSKAGAMGLMQLMPKTAQSLGVKNPFDVLENIDGGTKYIKKLVDSFGGNKELALSAYNGGIGRMNRRGVDTTSEINLMPKETQNYVAKVMKNYEDNKEV